MEWRNSQEKETKTAVRRRWTKDTGARMKWMGQWGMETTARKTLMELGDRSQENVCGAARTRRTKSMEQGEGGESRQEE